MEVIRLLMDFKFTTKVKPSVFVANLIVEHERMKREQEELPSMCGLEQLGSQRFHLLKWKRLQEKQVSGVKSVPTC